MSRPDAGACWKHWQIRLPKGNQKIMASWMIHLRVAQQLYRELHIKPVSEFVLGNIAPDSGVPTEDGSGFVPDKSVSHFYALNDDSSHYICEDLFIQRYFSPERRSSCTREEYAFLLGYLTHLLTDVIWAREFILSIKEQQNALYRSNKKLFYQSLKKDWYDLDFMYLKANPSFEAFRIYRENDNVKNTYLDIFSETAFEERRQFILDFYADGVANVVERDTYLSKEDMDAFVISAANEIIQRIHPLTIPRPSGIMAS